MTDDEAWSTVRKQGREPNKIIAPNMAPVNPDNSPIPQPVTWYAPVPITVRAGDGDTWGRVFKSMHLLARLLHDPAFGEGTLIMARNQARITLNRWNEAVDSELDAADLAESRVAAVRALCDAAESEPHNDTGQPALLLVDDVLAALDTASEDRGDSQGAMTDQRDTPDTRESVMLVEPGWTRSHFIRNAGGDSYRVLEYADGAMRFEHKCKVIDGTQIICAPRLQLDNGHRVVSADPLTVEPSIACPDCGTHGFIVNGSWVQA